MAKNGICFKCLPSFIREWHSWMLWQKNSQQSRIDCFFATTSTNVVPWWNWQALKTFVILCHQFFLDFTIHSGIIRAKTWMGTFQHFFHECKWQWHIGDVFLNILVSYLHFSDLVWISYEVFKLTVKRSKGKSIRGAQWLGQNWWLLGIRGKTDEWDTTRGINLIIPKRYKWST